MSLSTWLRTMANRSPANKPRRSRRSASAPQSRLDLCLELLEDRLAPATLHWIGGGMSTPFDNPGMIASYWQNYPGGVTTNMLKMGDPAWIGANPPPNPPDATGLTDSQTSAIHPGPLTFTDIAANSFQPYVNFSSTDAGTQQVAANWAGQILIPGAPGSTAKVTFETGSDDGSVIYIDGNLVVNNDAIQGVTYVASSAQSLTAGFHDILVEYMNGCCGAGLFTLWDPTGGSNFVNIPASVLFHGNAYGNWSDPANWAENAVPQNGDSVVFDPTTANFNSTAGYFTYNDMTNLTLSSIVVNNGSATSAFVMNGHALTVTGGITDTSTAAFPTRLKFDAINLGNNVTIANGSAAGTIDSPTLSITSNIDLAGHTLTEGTTGGVTDTGVTKLSGVISSSTPTTDSVVQAGGGSLILSNSNTYDGATTISSGTVVAAADNALGASTGAAKSVAGAATLAVAAGGDDAAYTNGFTLATGATVGTADTMADVLNAPLTFSGNGSLAVDTGTLALGGVVTSPASGALTKSGAGTAILTGNNAMLLSPISITGGLLTDAGANSVGTGATPITVASGSAFGVGGGQTYTSSVPLSITGSGPSTNDVQTITSTAATGTFTMSFGGQTTAVLQYNTDGPTIQSAFTALSSVGAGNATVTGPAGGPWVVSFIGVLGAAPQPLVSIDNSAITGGNVTIAHTTVGVLPNGALQGNGGNSAFVGTINGTGDEYLGVTAGTFTLNQPINLAAKNLLLAGPGGNLILTGAITGPATSKITKFGAGTASLANDNSATFLGSITIDGGVLDIAVNGALGGGTGAITVNSGGSLGLSGNVTLAQPISISGSGQTGNGAIENTGDTNTITGTISLNADSAIGSDAGTLTINGSIARNAFGLDLKGAGDTVVNGAITATPFTSTTTGFLESQVGVSSGGSSGFTDWSAGPDPSLGTDITPTPTMGENQTPNIGGNIPQATTLHTWTSNDTFIYDAKVFFPNDPLTPGSGTLSFAKSIDDDTLLKIDGVTYIDNGSFFTPLGTGPITLSTGPHDIEIRFGNGCCGAGPAGNGNGWTGFSNNNGFIYRIDSGPNDPLANSKNAADYIIPGDNGTPQIFFAAAPSGFAKDGTGTVTLNGTNTFVGYTQVNAGALVVGNASALGAAGNSVVVSVAPTKAAGGTLVLPAGVSLPAGLSLAVAGTGPAGGGAIESLGGDNTIAGSITILAAGSSNRFAAFGVDAGTLTISGPIGGGSATGPAGLGKAGPGILVLSGTNTYVGPTGIFGGTLQVVNDATLANNTTYPVTIDAGTLAFTGNDSSALNYVLGDPASTINVDSGKTVTVNNIILGSGGLTKTGAGSLVLAGSELYGGNTSVAAGTLIAKSKLALGTGPVTLAGGTLSLQNTGFTQQPLALTGFNQDVVWAKTESDPLAGTSIALNSGGNPYDFYEQGAPFSAGNGGGGLPSSGTIISQTNPAVAFQLQPYTADNASLVADNTSSVTMTLANPAAYAALNVLDFSVGGSTYNMTLNFADGTSDSTAITGAMVPDWDTAGGAAFGPVNEILRNSQSVNYYSNSPPFTVGSLFEQDFTLPAADQAKTLASITFTQPNGGILGVMAISGQNATMPDGFANNVAVTADSTIDVPSNGYSMGALSVQGSKLTLTGTGTTLTFGPTTVSGIATFSPAAGETLNLGAITGSGATPTIKLGGAGTLNLGTVANGVTVAGTGSIGSGGLSMAAGATDSPSLTSTSGDLITSSGPVSIGGATLNVNYSGSPPANDQRFTIISNTSGSPISGTFAGLPEGGVFAAGGSVFTITYKGGSGHDVVLQAVLQNLTHFVVTPAVTSAATGTPVAFTVTALDMNNLQVIGYTGTVHFTSSDGQAVLPPSGQLSNGTGVFNVTFETAGSKTLTATDSVTSSITGTSAPVQIGGGAPPSASYFIVSAPSGTQTTGSPFNVTVTAVDAHGVTFPGYTGTVHLTSTDGSATLPADATLTNGVGTFQVTLNTAGNQTVTASDVASLTTPPLITGTSGTIVTRGLVVTQTKFTGTGVEVDFSKAFDPSKLTMYGSGLATVQDVTLVGSTNGPITGTLYVDPSNKSVTFKATEASLSSFFSTFVLPDDSYTLTVVSGTTNGFTDGSAPLDGGALGGNGGHANFVLNFTVANGTKEILSLPDFARGPDGANAINIPAATAGAGIPVTLSNATAVTDVTFSVTYNPALLNITGPTSGNLMLVGTPTGGVANFTYHNGTAQNGTVVLGGIVATVPNSAGSQYKAKELLSLSNITVNGAAFTGVWANGIHVNAYLGDVTGNGTIDALDVATANNVAGGSATGFGSYTLLDPAIVGDPQGDISVDAGDVTALAAFVSHLPTPTIPAIPTGVTITPLGADPTLNLSGDQGVVSVLLDHPNPVGGTGMTEAILALSYDPKVLSVSSSDITLGSIPSQGTGWQISSVVDAATGQIGITLYSTTPITRAQAGSLVNIAFHVLPGATVSASSVQLINRSMAGGQQFTTQVDDTQGQFILSPGVDRLAISTGVSQSVTLVTVGDVVNVVRADLAATDIVPSVTEETTGSLLGAEAHDALAVMSNGAVTGEPAPHAVPANLVVTGALAFQNNATAVATQIAGQVFQVGTVNSLLNTASPQQLMDRVFLALARYTSAEQAQDNLWDGTSLKQDWLAIPTQTPAAATEDASATPDQKAADQQQAVSERIAVVDQVFALMPDDGDDFANFGG